MKFVRKMENVFKRYIEGFFNKKFSSGLEPVEIAKSLRDEMESKRFVGVNYNYVPNHYYVYLNNVDYEKIHPYRMVVIDELKQYIQKQAKQNDYLVVGNLIIDFMVEKELTLGTFRVNSEFTEQVEAFDKVQSEEKVTTEDKEHTRVFTKIAVAIAKNNVKKSAKLIVIKGPDTGKESNISERRINIGRRESNELPLTDANVSRLNAYVVYEDGEHVLYDAKSLNGTYLNNSRIVKKILTSGDHIKMGNTTIKYEVN